MRQDRIDLSICAYTRSIELEAPAPSLRVEALTNRGAARYESGEIDDVLRARALKDVPAECFALIEPKPRTAVQTKLFRYFVRFVRSPEAAHVSV
jgi:hypothetical protein